MKYAVATCQTDFPCPRDRSEISSRVDRMLEANEHCVAFVPHAQERAHEVIPTPLHVLDRISPIFSPFFSRFLRVFTVCQNV